MVCESWKADLDSYLDGELPEREMRTFDEHVRDCPSCSSDALARVQMKRAIQVAGKRFVPSSDFRRRIEQSITPKPQRSFRLGWMLAAATAVILVVGTFNSTYVGSWSGKDQASRDRVYSEIADLHVATLASSSPVDVISTDRHTVKPWFQGKIPFAFNLPELQNTGFTLLGGRMTYLDQIPGAHLIYDVRKHHISVFVFQARSFSGNLKLPMSNSSLNKLSFNTETWSENGLRYFVIGDASSADIDGLAQLFKGAT
jgi:anti-sigma factor RsiW